MSGFIVKQPNRRYCRHSTVLDCPSHWNMTFDDYVRVIIERFGYTEQKAKEEAKDTIENYLHDFPEMLDCFIPNNMTTEQFETVLQEMGYGKDRKE